MRGRLPLVVGLALLMAGDAGRAESPIATIAGGSFLMETDRATIPELKERYGVGFPGVFDNEAPAHRVTVSGFRMDRYEVTYARFGQFLEENPAWRRERLPAELHNGDYLADWSNGSFPIDKADHPVVFTTWHSAQAFCRWAGGRLPTEAEWEYAARAGGDREFPWGDELPLPERANYHASGFGMTTPVGSYPPNEFGLHDLAGNVWEFLVDEWVDEYSGEPRIDPLAGGPVDDARLLEVEGRRAVRGASYGGSVVNLRTRWRDSHVVTNAIAFVGFRCAYPAVVTARAGSAREPSRPRRR